MTTGERANQLASELRALHTDSKQTLLLLLDAVILLADCVENLDRDLAALQETVDRLERS